MTMSVGTNLASVPYYTVSFPFLNIFKTGGGWWTATASNLDTGEAILLYTSFLDANGYPTALTGGPAHTFDRVYCPVLYGGSTTFRSGRYVFLYDGVGTFSFDNDLTYVSGAGTGRILLDCTPSTGSRIFLLTTGSPAATNFRLVYADTAQGGVTATSGVIHPNEVLVNASQTPVTGAANNGSGLVRLAVNSTANWSNGDKITVTGVLGTTEANGTWTITIIDSTHVDLAGTTFANAYSSGGIAGDLSKAFNPDFISKTAPFKTLRFMDWAGMVVNLEAAWTDRTLANWAFWNDFRAGAAQGLDPRGSAGTSGAPKELMIALCNKLGSDFWCNQPILSTDAYVTSFATLTHSMLNSNLKVYVEYGNEIWNNGSNYTPWEPWLTKMPALARAQFTGGGLSDGTVKYSYGVLRAVQNNNTWKTVWGADASRVIRVLGGQNAGVGNNDEFALGMFPNGSTVQGDPSQGGPTYWYGTENLAAHNYFDVLAVAPYFGYSVPTAWSADSAGMTKLFAEINSGGQIPLGPGSANTTAGTSVTSTLVSDAAWGNGSVPATPANGQVVEGVFGKTFNSTVSLSIASPCVVTWTAHGLVADTPFRIYFNSGAFPTGITADATKGSGTNVSIIYYVISAGLGANSFEFSATVGGAAISTSGTQSGQMNAYVEQLHLSVDGGTSYPFMDNNGTYLDGFGLAHGTYFIAVFTSAVASGAPALVGWRAIIGDQGYSTGMIQQTIDWSIQNKTKATSYGLSLCAYEAGQTLVAKVAGTPITDLNTMLVAANVDARMGTAYTSLMTKWQSLGGDVFLNYIDMYPAGSNDYYWGALVNVLDATTAPKYAALINFITALGAKYPSIGACLRFLKIT